MRKFFSASLLWPLRSKPLETKGLTLGTAGAPRILLCLGPAVLEPLKVQLRLVVRNQFMKHWAWHPSLIEASTCDMLAAITITVLPALPRTLGLRYAVLWGARIHTSNLLNQISVAPRWGPSAPQPTCCSQALVALFFLSFPSL